MNIALTDETIWPFPDEDLEWKLRYGMPTEAEKRQAASIIHAYQHLIMNLSERRRDVVIPQIRRAVQQSWEPR